MQDEKDYTKTIKLICELLQSDPTPEVILGLRESFETLSKQLRTGPFLEVFETTLSNIPFAALFSLLAAPDNRLIATVAEVTGQLLKPVTWAMVHQTFEEYIIQGLDHPHPVVKCLVLNQFLKCEGSSDPVSTIVTRLSRCVQAWVPESQFSSQYGPHLWKCLDGKSDNDSTKLAKQALTHLCNVGMGMDYLLTEASLKAIRTLLSGNESQRFRVYDVMVATTKNSDSAFELFRQEGVISAFLSEVSSDDVLVSMNFYELVPALCETPVSYDYLDSVGVFSKALNCLADAKTDDSVTGSLTRVAVLKLFSRMVDTKGAETKAFLEKYSVVRELGDILKSSESNGELISTAVNCLGAIGNNPAALEFLANEKEALKAFVSVYDTSLGHLRVE
ncbi:hypothetical protein GGI05_005048, partial [Coemansia sp. RSA 2603]